MQENNMSVLDAFCIFEFSEEEGNLIKIASEQFDLGDYESAKETFMRAYEMNIDNKVAHFFAKLSTVYSSIRGEVINQISVLNNVFKNIFKYDYLTLADSSLMDESISTMLLYHNQAIVTAAMDFHKLYAENHSEYFSLSLDYQHNMFQILRLGRDVIETLYNNLKQYNLLDSFGLTKTGIVLSYRSVTISFDAYDEEARDFMKEIDYDTFLKQEDKFQKREEEHRKYKEEEQKREQEQAKINERVEWIQKTSDKTIKTIIIVIAILLVSGLIIFGMIGCVNAIGRH